MELPDEPAHLPGYGDDDLVAVEPPCRESPESVVQAVLRPPRDGSDLRRADDDAVVSDLVEAPGEDDGVFVDVESDVQFDFHGVFCWVRFVDCERFNILDRFRPQKRDSPRVEPQNTPPTNPTRMAGSKAQPYCLAQEMYCENFLGGVSE